MPYLNPVFTSLRLTRMSHLLVLLPLGKDERKPSSHARAAFHWSCERLLSKVFILKNVKDLQPSTDQKLQCGGKTQSAQARLLRGGCTITEH